MVTVARIRARTQKKTLFGFGGSSKCGGCPLLSSRILAWYGAGHCARRSGSPQGGVIGWQLLLWGSSSCNCCFGRLPGYYAPFCGTSAALYRYIRGHGGWHEVTTLQGTPVFRPKWVGPKGQSAWSAEFVQQEVRGRGGKPRPFRPSGDRWGGDHPFEARHTSRTNQQKWLSSQWRKCARCLASILPEPNRVLWNGDSFVFHTSLWFQRGRLCAHHGLCYNPKVCGTEPSRRSRERPDRGAAVWLPGSSAGPPEVSAEADRILGSRAWDKVGYNPDSAVLSNFKWDSGVGRAKLRYKNVEWDVVDYGDKLPISEKLEHIAGPAPSQTNPQEIRQCLMLHCTAGLMTAHKGRYPTLQELHPEAQKHREEGS